MSAPVAAARDSAGVPHASLHCTGVRTATEFQPARKSIWLWFSQKMKCTVAWHRGGTLCKRVHHTVGKSIMGLFRCDIRKQNSQHLKNVRLTCYLYYSFYSILLNQVFYYTISFEATLLRFRKNAALFLSFSHPLGPPCCQCGTKLKLITSCSFIIMGSEKVSQTVINQ